MFVRLFQKFLINQSQIRIDTVLLVRAYRRVLSGDRTMSLIDGPRARDSLISSNVGLLMLSNSICNTATKQLTARQLGVSYASLRAIKAVKTKNKRSK